jgi:hypothetical protein
MKKSTIKTIIKEELKAALKENISIEASQLHAMTSCGQDAAQNFFDDHNIDAKKLVAYVQQNKQNNPTLVYDVRDYISGRKGTVGGEKTLRDKFIKQFKMGLKEVGPAYRTSSFTKSMAPDTFALYQEYAQKIDVTDPSAINNHDTLQKVMLNDPRVQKSSQKFLLQTALGWAMTFAQEMER